MDAIPLSDIVGCSGFKQRLANLQVQNGKCHRLICRVKTSNSGVGFKLHVWAIPETIKLSETSLASLDQILAPDLVLRDIDVFGFDAPTSLGPKDRQYWEVQTDFSMRANKSALTQ